MGELREALDEASMRLGRSVEAYVIGGLAMMKYGTKASTKDVDLVFKDAPDEREVETALRSCGFHDASDLPDCYTRMEARIILERSDGLRFDIFVERVCNKLRLTEGMMRRAGVMDIGGRLRLMVLAPEDVFLFKSVTERDDDLADMAQIAGRGLDLVAMVEELRTDAENFRYIPFLVARLDVLEEAHGIALPGRRRLRSEAEVVCAINMVEGLLRRGPVTLAEVMRLLGEGDDFSRSILKRMVEMGIAFENDGRYALRARGLEHGRDVGPAPY